MPSKRRNLALLGRAPRLGCRIVRSDDRRYEEMFDDRRVRFDDVCGAAAFTSSGACLAGPCSRGMDRFAIAVTDGRARVDLDLLTPGAPRGGVTTR